MNKTDLNTLEQIFILSLEGISSYELKYQYPTSPLLSDIAIQTANFCKFLIKLNENKINMGIKNE